MGKKTKIGKQRKDKYYQLAKETGFRSRAAFKLIQLNRKFEFLQKSRVCLDLCAAPGGWMQVAKQNMPVSSIVIGIDLFPIKPMSGCIGLTEDITTDKCRTAIGKELKTWKADVVLHDGAPNVGKNWLHDAYQQACLTLSALKLAVQFLREGGWFVTKVFRSKDYNPLIWVLKQFFSKVHATKPHASRNESAEIFVVCQFYIAPAKVDDKLLDPKYVFSELEMEPATKLNLLHPEKRRKQAEGYPENDHTLYHRLPVSEFIQHDSGIDALQKASEIVFDDAAIASHAMTTNEIKECCKDIKVLGRKDLRTILNWWKALHAEYETKKKQELEEQARQVNGDEQVEASAKSDEEEEEVNRLIGEAEEEERKELKRKKKRAAKERQKLNDRLNLKMVLKGDEGPTMEGDDMFSLKLIKSKTDMNLVADQAPDLTVDSDDPDDDDQPAKPKYAKFQKDGGHLDSSGLYYKDSDSELEMESNDEDADDGIEEGLGLTDDDDEEVIQQGPMKTRQRVVKETPKKAAKHSGEDHPLITDLDDRDANTKKAHKAELFFQREIFKNLIDDKDEDADLDRVINEYKRKGAQVIGEDVQNSEKSSAVGASNEKRNSQSDDEEDEADDTDSDSDTDCSEYNIERTRGRKKKRKEIAKNGFEVVPAPSTLKKRKLTVEDLALGTMMINSKKAKRDLIDGAWNRYAFNDTNLPDWFVIDEKKHMRKEVPVPKEMVKDYTKRMGELNGRTIKKVVEAKARKKRRAAKKLEQAKKKVETLIDSVDVTDRDKSRQIKQIYKKARAEPKKEVTYVVARKFMGGKVSRPAGVKGRYRVVDPRMKKDKRSAKSRAKKETQKKGGKRYSRKPTSKKNKSQSR